MTTKLSSKGQVVLPKRARMRLHLRPGARFVCKVQGDSIVLTPEHPVTEGPRLINDPKSGLRITQAPAETKVTSEEVNAALADFPSRYLLDVNALIALAHTGHSLHAKAIRWYLSVLASATGFHTCSITELGFVRVTVVTGLQSDLAGAKAALDALKSSSKVRFELLADDLGAAHLPAFVKKPQSVMGGHLGELARKHAVRLVTLDRGIPGSLFIG